MTADSSPTASVIAHPGTGALAYYDDGLAESPAVLMGSSLGTTGQMWAAQVPALSEHFRVVRFDHLGHGASQVPTGPYSLDQLGTAVLELMDALSIDRASYVGLSLGGLVGQWLALNAPDRIDRLVVMCTAAYFPTPESWAERAEAVRAGGTAAVSDAVLGRWFTSSFVQSSPDLVAGYKAMVEATPAEGYAGCCAALGGADLRGDLRRVCTPTLVIAGDQDPSTPPERLREIADAIPGARLEVISAAHLANVEQADIVNDLILAHLMDRS